MDIELDDVLKVNVVFLGIHLLRNSDDRERFKRSAGTEVVEGALDVRLAIGISPVGLPSPTTERPLPSLVLNRDRITVNSTPERSEVSKDFPSKIGDLGRLTEITNQAIEFSDLRGQRLQAYGFNLEAVCSLAVSAGEFLSQNILNPRPFTDLGYQLIGGTSNLQVMKGPHLWNLRFEPRFGDYTQKKIFIAVNLHKDSQVIPTEQNIRQSLFEIWTQAQAITDGFKGS